MVPRPRAFTLIELLVVVAIIALLMAILLPSLSYARAIARAAKCGAQMSSVGKAVATYLAENSDTFPSSYVYVDNLGNYIPSQAKDPTNAYQHWSCSLFGNSKTLAAFTCPEFERGGVPRTNPGIVSSNWMSGQEDANGNKGPGGGAVEDLQAPFVAFAANEAVMPRNKFTAVAATSDGGNGIRLNVYVKRTTITSAESRTILATEFNKNWTAVAKPGNSGGLESQSHRSINPFFDFSAGYNEFQAGAKDFFVPTDYHSLSDGPTAANLPPGTLANQNAPQLDVVGRNHPGSFVKDGKSYGGTSNFLYIDGHVERKNVVETLLYQEGKWEWGNQFYSLNGNTEVKF